MSMRQPKTASEPRVCMCLMRAFMAANAMHSFFFFLSFKLAKKALPCSRAAISHLHDHNKRTAPPQLVPRTPWKFVPSVFRTKSLPRDSTKHKSTSNTEFKGSSKGTKFYKQSLKDTAMSETASQPVTKQSKGSKAKVFFFFFLHLLKPFKTELWNNSIAADAIVSISISKYACNLKTNTN